MSYLNKVTITQTLPCIAMPERIRFVAEFDCDVSEMMPYLNAVLEDAIFNPNGPSITLKRDGRLIGIQPRQLAVGKVIDLIEANKWIEWVQSLINDYYEKRDTIKPNYERASFYCRWIFINYYRPRIAGNAANRVVWLLP